MFRRYVIRISRQNELQECISPDADDASRFIFWHLLPPSADCRQLIIIELADAVRFVYFARHFGFVLS